MDQPESALAARHHSDNCRWRYGPRPGRSSRLAATKALVFHDAHSMPADMDASADLKKALWLFLERGAAAYSAIIAAAEAALPTAKTPASPAATDGRRHCRSAASSWGAASAVAAGQVVVVCLPLLVSRRVVM
jgi:hypothetical protein